MINLELFIVAIALGCDAFSVAIAIGARGISARRIFRLAWHFGLFQFFMPLIGLAIGQYSAALLGHLGKGVAAFCLVVIGYNMARSAFRPAKAASELKDPTRGWSLIILSISTSVDALIAGFSLGLSGVNILISCLVIGITAGLMTILGMVIGAGSARVTGKWAELFGGVVLMVLGIIIVLR